MAFDKFEVERLFLAFMEEHGLELEHGQGVVYGKKYNLCKADGKSGAGRYTLYDDDWPAGAIWNFHNGKEKITWKFPKDEAERRDWKPKAEYQTERQKKQQEDAAKAKQAAVEREAARKKAEHEYSTFKLATAQNPYLASKGLEPRGDLRQVGKTLIIPLWDVTSGAFTTFQNIYPTKAENGETEIRKFEKRFKGGVESKGGVFTLDATPGASPIGVILAEGISTALSIFDALEWRYTVLCACTSGNLALVAKAVRAKYADVPLYVAQDYDSAGEHAAAAAMGAGFDGVLIPPFADEELESPVKRPSDWDDFRGLSGIKAAGLALEAAIKEARQTPKESRGNGMAAANTKVGGAVKSMDVNLKPTDLTDLGEMNILAREYRGVLRHSTATKYISYNGKVWKESEARARSYLHLLTDRQLEQSGKELAEAKEVLEAAKADYIAVTNGKKKTERETDTQVKNAAQELIDATETVNTAMDYYKFVLGRRKSATISGVMLEAQTPLEIEVSELDANPFSLNTPGGEVDLRTGALLPHKAENFHTKITGVPPSMKGAELWKETIELVTCGDVELMSYLQLIAGQIAIGRVFAENLIIAYGAGANGKSTVFNTIARVLGDYSGQLSAENLTTGHKNSKCYEIADLRGQRLIIAPELEEGTRLDAAFVKKICSTDKIKGEKKYKDAFDFTPSHTTVLYTNHLPRVGSDDAGTWRRLVVVPFNARIEGKSDKKNYADYLYRNAGGAVLSWIIEGAKRYIAAEYHIEPPECVKQAVEAYKTDNDWLSDFLSECCEVGKVYRVKAGELMTAYKGYCERTATYRRSREDFKATLEKRGFTWRQSNAGAEYWGLRVIEQSFYSDSEMATQSRQNGYFSK